jgi:hypothetical protein
MVKKKERRRIRICPRCKNSSLRPFKGVSGWFTPPRFECSECDYVGRFFIEIDPNDFKLDEEPE